MIIESPQFVLDHVFHRHVTGSDVVIYYRDCCTPDSRPDEQGYLGV